MPGTIIALEVEGLKLKISLINNYRFNHAIDAIRYAVLSRQLFHLRMKVRTLQLNRSL